METFWERLRSRKMVEWAIAYLAIGFALLQLADFMKDAFSWPTVLLRVLTVVVAFGFVAVLVIAWYHGEKGHQRMPAGEIAMLVTTVILAVVVSWYVAARTPEQAVQNVTMGGDPASDDAQLTLFDPSTAGNSVAVLPFDNLTPDEQNDYIAEGITEDIITKLGTIEGLRVISRTSVMRYKDTDKSLREIGAELGVKSILEGSVRVQGNRIRIVAQLIDVATDGHLWAETYDREIKDVLTVQSEVAQSIAKALNTELMPQGVVAAEEMPEADPETFRLYSLGKSLANNGTEADREKAVQVLDSVVQRDPDFAPALNALVSLQVPVALDPDMVPEPQPERMMNVVTRAAQLSPRSAEAQSALAFVRAMQGSDLAAAEKSGREAVESNPNSVHARLRYAQILYSNGHPDEAMRQINAAVALDPLSPVVHAHAGDLAASMKNMQEAESHLSRAIELDSTAVTPRVALSMVYSEEGRTDEALRMAESAARLKPNDVGVIGSYASLLARAGRRDEAHKIAERLEKMASEGRPLHTILAQVHASIGDMEQAVEWLRKGAADQRRKVVFFPPRFRYTFEQMQKDPRMAKVLDSLGYRFERRVSNDSSGARRNLPRPNEQGSRSRTGDRR
jgi:TolB-like protein/tetratricopeptide (TPR) repeat protein